MIQRGLAGGHRRSRWRFPDDLAIRITPAPGGMVADRLQWTRDSDTTSTHGRAPPLGRQLHSIRLVVPGRVGRGDRPAHETLGHRRSRAVRTGGRWVHQRARRQDFEDCRAELLRGGKLRRALAHDVCARRPRGRMTRLLRLWRIGANDLRLVWYALRHPDRPAWLLPVV